MKITLVARIGSGLKFVADSQAVEAIKADYPPDHPIRGYDAFFVSPHTREPWYAMSGVIPYVFNVVAYVPSMGDTSNIVISSTTKDKP